MDNNILSQDIVNKLLSQNKNIYVLIQNKKIVSINNIGAFIFFSLQEFDNIKSSFKQDVKYASFKKCDNTFDLMPLFLNNDNHYIEIINYGRVQRKDCIRNDAQHVTDLCKIFWDKTDKDFIYSIRVDDHTYTKNGTIPIYINERQAIEEATAHQGRVVNISLLDIQATKYFKQCNYYLLQGKVYTNMELYSALKYKFIKQCLDVEEVTRLVKNQLYIYLGYNKNGLVIYKRNGNIVLFTDEFDKSRMPDEAIKNMPPNAKLIKIESQENLLSFEDSEYVFFDEINHAEAKVFLDAINGAHYNNTRKEALNKKLQQVADLFKIYIILSDDVMDGTSLPRVFNAQRPTIWLFTDYTKALLFCQLRGLYTSDGRPLIGEISAMVDGYDLTDTLSLAHWAGVKMLEIDPLEKDRVLVNIEDFFHITTLRLKEEFLIYRVWGKDDYEKTKIADSGFNPFVL